jgi:outer membrane lipoprotein SlyB
MTGHTVQPSKGSIGLVVLVWLTAALGGCESIERAIKRNPQTAVGAGAGAAGGALIGGLAGSTQGAVIGGLSGVLVGGAIGALLDRQQRTREATMVNVAYSQEQGQLVRIEAVDINPPTIRPGETVNVNVQYAILTPQGTAPVRVREVRQLFFGGELVGNPVVQIERTDGTYWSTLPIRLPASAAPGRYDVVVGIETNGVLDRWQTRFTVVP